MSLINSHPWKEGGAEETRRYLLYVGMMHAALPGVGDIVASSDHPDAWDEILPDEVEKEGYFHDHYDWWKIVDKTTMQVVREADFISDDFIKFLRPHVVVDLETGPLPSSFTLYQPNEHCVEGVVEIKRSDPGTGDDFADRVKVELEQMGFVDVYVGPSIRLPEGFLDGVSQDTKE